MIINDFIYTYKDVLPIHLNFITVNCYKQYFLYIFKGVRDEYY